MDVLTNIPSHYMFIINNIYNFMLINCILQNRHGKEQGSRKKVPGR